MEEDKKKTRSKKKLIILRITLLLILLLFLPFWINTYSRMIADYYTYKGYFPKAIKVAEYAIKIDNKLFGNESKAAVEAQEELANYYLYWGDAKTALKYYLIANKLREYKNYKSGFKYSYAISNIATCYLDLYDFKKAEFYYKKNLEIDKKQNQKNLELADIVNLIALYIQTNQLGKADEQINQIGLILKEKNIQKNIHYPSIVYAKVKYYEQIGNLQMAKNLIDDILSTEKTLSKGNKTMFLGELAKIYQLQGKFNESERILNELIVKNKNNDYEKAKVLRKIALFNIKIKNYKLAEDYLKKSLKLKEKRAYKYSYEVACDYNYLLMINPQNKEYIKYFNDYLEYINNSVSINKINLYLNSSCDY